MKVNLLVFFLFLGFSLGAQTQGPFQFTSPRDKSAYLPEELTAPFTFTGTCTPDVQSITVTWTNEAINSPAVPFTLKKFKPGDKTFLYRAHIGLKNLAEGTNNYTFIFTLKNGTAVNEVRQLFYMRHVGERAKPVIYLYPQTAMDVSVKVAPKEGLKITIPEMGSGWKVTADPTGKIVNKSDGKAYPYLFWESPDASPAFNPVEGFVVDRPALENFFEQKLKYMGLNPQEIQEFLDFWLPLMTSYPHYLIAFTPKAILDRDAPLSISPVPDTVIRVYFEHKGLRAPMKIPAQVLSKGERKGFTVVEWGGRKN